MLFHGHLKIEHPFKVVAFSKNRPNNSPCPKLNIRFLWFQLKANHGKQSQLEIMQLGFACVDANCLCLVAQVHYPAQRKKRELNVQSATEIISSSPRTKTEAPFVKCERLKPKRFRGGLDGCPRQPARAIGGVCSRPFHPPKPCSGQPAKIGRPPESFFRIQAELPRTPQNATGLRDEAPK